MIELQHIRPGALFRFADDPDGPVYERRAGRRTGSRQIAIRAFGTLADRTSYAERDAEPIAEAEASDLRAAAAARPPISVTAYEYPLVEKAVSAWIAADAPDTVDAAPFSARTTIRDGFLVVERWRYRSVSVAGAAWSGYMFLFVYSTKLRKNGELAANWINRAEAENVKDAVRGGHSGWLAANRPAEFIFYS